MHKHHIDDLVEAISAKIVPGRKVTREHLNNSIRTEIDNYFKDKIAVVWMVSDCLHAVKEILEDCETPDDVAMAFGLNPGKLTVPVTKEDVQNFFSTKACKTILNNILDNHEADRGVHWETIRYSCIEAFRDAYLSDCSLYSTACTSE